jgi:ATP-dependent DNA helicase HFM1/MER3
LATVNTGPTRFSLANRSTYNQPDNEPRAVSNAENHFRFPQNLRRGAPANQPAVWMNNFNHLPAQSPFSQLATNMVLQRPVPQASPEQMNLFQGLNTNRLNQLQPRRQEITPPFNLSRWLSLLF